MKNFIIEFNYAKYLNLVLLYDKKQNKFFTSTSNYTCFEIIKDFRIPK